MSENRGLGAVHEAAGTVSRSDHEAAVAAAREEGRTSGFAAGRAEGLNEGQAGGSPGEQEIAASRAAGAAAERTRILGIQAHQLPGTEALVAEMVADGTTTPDQAAARILGEVKAQGPRALQALKADEPRRTGSGATAAGGGDLSAYDRGRVIALRAKGKEVPAA